MAPARSAPSSAARSPIAPQPLGPRADGTARNHAAVCDVNGDPRTPAIGTRSFGDDAAAGARDCAQWVKGSEGAGVATSPKHFPGHGATTDDTHHTTVDVTADRATLERRGAGPVPAGVAPAAASGLATTLSD